VAAHLGLELASWFSSRTNHAKQLVNGSWSARQTAWIWIYTGGLAMELTDYGGGGGVSLSNANLRSSSSNVTQRRAQGLGSLIAGH